MQCRHSTRLLQISPFNKIPFSLRLLLLLLFLVLPIFHFISHHHHHHHHLQTTTTTAPSSTRMNCQPLPAVILIHLNPSQVFQDLSLEPVCRSHSPALR